MANTFTADGALAVPSVMGAYRIAAGVLTMTDGAGGVDVGLNDCVGGAVTPKTVTTGGFGTVWQTASGNVHIYSCASGDTFNVWAFGR